jgi:hypothetical protein
VEKRNHAAPALRPGSLALDKPLVFPKAKDRPIVITALAARSDWLLTLDEGDFHTKLGREVYGLRIATPGEFLLEQRAQGGALSSPRQGLAKPPPVRRQRLFFGRISRMIVRVHSVTFDKEAWED